MLNIKLTRYSIKNYNNILVTAPARISIPGSVYSLREKLLDDPGSCNPEDVKSFGKAYRLNIPTDELKPFIYADKYEEPTIDINKLRKAIMTEHPEYGEIYILPKYSNETNVGGYIGDIKIRNREEDNWCAIAWNGICHFILITEVTPVKCDEDEFKAIWKKYIAARKIDVLEKVLTTTVLPTLKGVAKKYLVGDVKIEGHRTCIGITLNVYDLLNKIQSELFTAMNVKPDPTDNWADRFTLNYNGTEMSFTIDADRFESILSDVLKEC